MTGITYFCTDRDGNVYVRYSAGHMTKRYAFATIFRFVGERASKTGISYSSRRKGLPGVSETTCRRPVRGADGHVVFSSNGVAEMISEPALSENVEVRAYAGRHPFNREPAADWQLA